MDRHIAICDDEKVFIDLLRDMMPDAETDAYTDPSELFGALKGGKTYDILFLDILMPGTDGITLAREIRVLDEDVIIVFITSRIEFAQTGYEVKAFRYLLKDRLGENFPKLWSDIEKELLSKEDKYFSYESGRRTYRFLCRDIVYFESNLRRVTLHALNETGTLYTKLDDIESAHPSFIRIHKSFLVNRRHIRSVSAGTVVTSAGDILPVSRKYARNAERII